ncbi:hypothetical protein CRE_12039 [Caenorhabditis remanei]|uniref:F-box domain-containing protein n=1 Tax=Caenorhabditis remanei TaxID=31234 RepID=E3MPX3_CAERE|nr:hypothetical protein CRE_12039 [Caenorhabditis remanei]
MSIQFLKLPWLTQLEVLKQLKIEEVFVISLCSEKLKRKVQSLNLKPGIVKYYFMENAIVAVVKDSEHDEVIHNVAMVTRVQEDPDDSFITIKLGGKKVTCK